MGGSKCDRRVVRPVITSDTKLSSHRLAGRSRLKAGPQPLAAELPQRLADDREWLLQKASAEAIRDAGPPAALPRPFELIWVCEERREFVSLHGATGKTAVNDWLRKQIARAATNVATRMLVLLGDTPDQLAAGILRETRAGADLRRADASQARPMVEEFIAPLQSATETEPNTLKRLKAELAGTQ